MADDGALGRGAGRRLLLVNPNTNSATTAAMVAIARTVAPEASIGGVTAPFGASLITNTRELGVAAEAVAAAADDIAATLNGSLRCDGLVVAAFGDPGLDSARSKLSLPVVGIAEASMRQAAAIGRFSVVTTTPHLVASIEGLADRYGCASLLASVRLTPGDAAEAMRDPALLVAALEAACRTAVAEDRIEAIVIGGGPLAAAARELAPRLPVPVIEPIPAAVALVLRLGAGCVVTGGAQA